VRIFSLFPVSTLAECVISDRRTPVFNQLVSDRRSARVRCLGSTIGIQAFVLIYFFLEPVERC
jgi:hypothetical protein